MSIETSTKSISPTLSNLIAEINYSIDSVKEKILAAYDYAIDKDGYTPKQAAKLIRHKTEYSHSYIRKVLPLESKDKSKINKPNNAILESHNSQESDKNVVNITTAYDIKEAETGEQEEEEEEEYKPSSAMEEFRKQHGTVEQEQQPQQQQEEESDTIYDKQFVDRLVKENAKLQEENQTLKFNSNKIDKFTFEYDLEVKDQILPLLVTCFPDKKTGFVRFNKNKKQK